jgi:L-lactate dehydrogenase complex protein LldF
LCGACFDACPVRIDIPSILVHLRAAQVEQHRARGQDLAMGAAAWAMASPTRFAAAEKLLGAGRLVAGSDHRITALPWPGSRWTTSRDIPEPPAETFRQWWARTHDEASR